ncbi:MAG: prolipoprotein diacylglyceryl transferase [Neisseriaceae bacterium]
MLMHPNLSPVIFSIGPLAVRWYALAYVLGFLFFFYMSKRQIEKAKSPLRSLEDLDSLFLYGVLGVVVGGRLGYVCFYNLHHYLTQPLDIFKVWQGGMSFHGGLVGVVIAMALFAYQKRYHFLEISDLVAPLAPVGLGLGRIGNFINGELWGRITAPYHFWAMGFPQAQLADKNLVGSLPQIYQDAFGLWGALPRHPSQLYEALLEGLTLFLILLVFNRKKRPTGSITALFLILYGIFRFIIEFSRQPDAQIGLLALNLSMGQWLSLPMLVIGLGLYIFSKREP